MYAECISVGQDICLPIYYEELILKQEVVLRKMFAFLNIPFDEAVMHHEKMIGDEIVLSNTEPSTSQVLKAVNSDALNSWVGKIPEDVQLKFEKSAPMLRILGYDPMNFKPDYKDLDGFSFHLKQNVSHWQEFVNSKQNH